MAVVVCGSRHNISPRVGNALYAITDEKAHVTSEALNTPLDLDVSTLDDLANENIDREH